MTAENPLKPEGTCASCGRAATKTSHIEAWRDEGHRVLLVREVLRIPTKSISDPDVVAVLGKDEPAKPEDELVRHESIVGDLDINNRTTKRFDHGSTHLGQYRS